MSCVVTGKGYTGGRPPGCTLCAAQLILIAPFETAAASFTGQRDSQVAANMEYSVRQKAVFSSQFSCKQNIIILNGWRTY